MGAAIPRSIWALGLVSLCMDLSSELIHSLLPLYLAVGLGASTLTIGIIEGVAEAIALIAGTAVAPRSSGRAEWSIVAQGGSRWRFDCRGMPCPTPGSCPA